EGLCAAPERRANDEKGFRIKRPGRMFVVVIRKLVSPDHSTGLWVKPGQAIAEERHDLTLAPQRDGIGGAITRGFVARFPFEHTIVRVKSDDACAGSA